jgi:ADP-ribose pyrophosphatase
MGIRTSDGRPVNPWGPLLPYGRGELGHWGEKANADAIVLAIVGSQRYILLGERDDGNGWALPGGGREGKETGVANALRELREETGLVIDPVKRADQIVALPVRHVQDPRESRESWMVTVPVVINLGKVAQLPTVKGSDDLLRAEWVPCDTGYRVRDHIADLGGKVFPAHEQMITDAVHGALS